MKETTFLFSISYFPGMFYNEIDIQFIELLFSQGNPVNLKCKTYI